MTRLCYRGIVFLIFGVGEWMFVQDSRTLWLMTVLPPSLNNILIIVVRNLSVVTLVTNGDSLTSAVVTLPELSPLMCGGHNKHETQRAPTLVGRRYSTVWQKHINQMQTLKHRLEYKIYNRQYRLHLFGNSF